ncbi:AraC family transcriptional regulator [Paenibacillus cymbidii]|uniref:AraC family transcriptional regulator n=1 Tax=Paenibacillus cymbidii TaxID=1639034 RepID=UPI0010817162|nr:AraC family transcriptional regulator [Paenibacillus cymbidii]
MELGQFGVRILWTARYDYKHGNVVHPHWHDFYQLFCFLDGSGEFACGESLYPFEPGTLIFVKPGTMHSLIAHSKRTVKTLDIKFRIEDERMEKMAQGLPAYVQSAPREMAEWLETIRKEGLNRQAYFKEMGALVLTQLLYGLARLAVGKEAEEEGTAGGMQPVAALDQYEAAGRVAAYIEAHYAEPLSLAAIASATGYSPSYVSQIFKRSKQCTVAAYIKMTRIRHAKAGMLGAESALKRISEETGFKTIHHFSRVFKQLEKMTPGQWLAQERDGIRKGIHFE